MENTVLSDSFLAFCFVEDHVLHLCSISCGTLVPHFFHPAMVCSELWGSTGYHMGTKCGFCHWKSLCPLPVLFFFLVNHGCHYHYCWCSILFWSLDSGPAMIKNQIYSPVQSGAPVVPAKPAVLPALLLRSSNPANVYFRRLCLHSNIAVTWKFNHPVGGAHMNILLL